jgi:hypothetical protein
MYIMMVQKQKHDMTSIRVSDKMRARLGKIRARRTLKDGKEMSMEELLEMLADAYEEKEHKGDKIAVS